MNAVFVDILKKLIAEQGKEALLNPAKCKAFLADYTHGEYKKESRLLLQALDTGAQGEINATVELEICKKQQIRLLQEEHFLTKNAAADVVDTLALVLKGEQGKGASQGMSCSNCGKELQKEWAVCPYCGKSVAIKPTVQNKTETLYYTSYDYEEKGPFDASAINKMIASSQITDKYWIRLDNSSKWEPITKLFKFSSIVSSSSGGSGFGIPLIRSKDFNDFEIDTNGSEIRITKYIGVKSEIIIPSRIQNLLVTAIGDSAFRECSNLASVTIPDGVTKIGELAFLDCTSLTSVTIPDSVTSIGGNAFVGCSSLTSVTIPNSVISIGDSAFFRCRNLASVTIGNSVTSIGGWAFDECTRLTSVTFQGTINSSDFAFFTFPGNLRSKYLSEGIGTYTKKDGFFGSKWTKQS